MPMLVQNSVDFASALRAKLIPLLEGIHIVDWPFQFFGMESRCKINCKLKGLNRGISVV